MIAYQKYHEEWKNLYIKFGEYFGEGQFGVVQWGEFD